MKEITRAQEEVLRALWEIGDGAVSDVVNHFPDPKPAYTTVATVLKVLEKKGYVSHKVYGKTFVYHPLVSKREYARYLMKETFKGLFNNSLNQVITSFVKHKEVSLQELEELKQLIEKEIEQKRELK